MHVRFESAANQLEIPPNQYRQYMRGLNEKQRSIVMFHRDWCKKAVLALKEGKSVDNHPRWCWQITYHKVSVHSDTLKLLKLSGIFEPDDVIALPLLVLLHSISMA